MNRRNRREGIIRIDYVARLAVPVVFILLLPIAFASSVKNEDHADNSYAFTYDAESREIVQATSSKRYDLNDDVDVTVTLEESDDEAPLEGRVQFSLLKNEPIRYEGTVRFRVLDDPNQVAFEATREVSFRLRPQGRHRHERIKFPFDVPSGDYWITVKFRS